MANVTGRPTGKKGKAMVFTEKDQNLIFKVIKGGDLNAERNTAIVGLSFYLGLRVDEIAQLNVSHIYQDGALLKTLTLTPDMTKGDKFRTLALENKRLAPKLTAYVEYLKTKTATGELNPNAPLFISQKKVRYSSNTLSRLFKRIYETAGFDNATSHSGRRSLITQLSAKGVELNLLRQVAGHSSVQTTQRYVDDNPKMVADVLNNF